MKPNETTNCYEFASRLIEDITNDRIVSMMMEIPTNEDEKRKIEKFINKFEIIGARAHYVVDEIKRYTDSQEKKDILDEAAFKYAEIVEIAIKRLKNTIGWYEMSKVEKRPGLTESEWKKYYNLYINNADFETYVRDKIVKDFKNGGVGYQALQTVSLIKEFVESAAINNDSVSKVDAEEVLNNMNRLFAVKR